MQKIIDSLVRNKKTFFLKAEGLSMLPLLKPGDVLFLRRIKFQQVKINDLIMAKNGKIILTHRVIYKNKDYLITKGDNNQKSDGKVYPHQVIGKVYQIKRNGRIIDLENFYLLQSTLYFNEIVQVKKMFDKDKIDYVFLKGLPLHLYYEKTHPKRIYADCDVIIAGKDYANANKILTRFGYKQLDFALSLLHRILKDKPVEITFYKEINKLPILFDIHFEIAFLIHQLGSLETLYPQRLIDKITGEFLKSKKLVKIQNDSFPILNTEYLILYLALHFFHHSSRGIHRLEMIDKVIRRMQKWEARNGKVDKKVGSWNKIAEKIRYFRVQNFVYPAFLMLKKYFNTPLPRGFLSSIKPKEEKIRYIKKNIMKINVFDDEPRVKAGINRFKNIFFLSPEPVYRKVLVFLNPAVFYSILWVLYKKFISFLRLSFWKVNPIKAP